MPHLRQHERDRTVGMVQAGMHQIEIANHFECSKLTITRLMSRLRQTGSTSDRSCSGCPREMTLRQDHHIRLIHLRDRFVPATVTARQTQGRHNPRISAQTVCNRLKAAGLRSRRPVVGAVLTQRHRNRITLMFYHGLICRRLSTYGMNLTNECIGIHNNLNLWIN
jgi:transposase